VGAGDDGLGVVVGAPVVARVQPGDRQVAVGLVDRQAGQELAVGGVVVVDLDPVAPGGPVVVGEAQEDVGVVALVRLLVGVGHVQPAAVRAVRQVVGQVGLGVDGAAVLGRDEVEAAGVGVGDQGL